MSFRCVHPSSSRNSTSLRPGPAKRPIFGSTKKTVIVPANLSKKRAAGAPSPPSSPPKRSRVAPSIDGILAADSKLQIVPYLNPLPAPRARSSWQCQLFTWESGGDGQLSVGPDILGGPDRPRRSVEIKTGIAEGKGMGIEAVAIGGRSMLFIDETGTVWNSVSNDEAAFGRVTTQNSDKTCEVEQLEIVPHALSTLVNEGFRAVRVSSGNNICAAISEKGELRVWGWFNRPQELSEYSEKKMFKFIPPLKIVTLTQKQGDYEKVVSAAAGQEHLIVLTTHGKVFTWGMHEQGQLGRRNFGRRNAPIANVPTKLILGKRCRKAVVVGAGNHTSFAVDTEGNTWGWGLNDMGQTGTGYQTSSDRIVGLPQRVLGLDMKTLEGDRVIEIAGGKHHTLFLTAAGNVYACGRSGNGQLGLDSHHVAFKDCARPDCVPEPVIVAFPDGDPIVEISVGRDSSCAVSRSGALYVWGQVRTGIEGEQATFEEVRVPRMMVRKEGTWRAVSAVCGGRVIGLFDKQD